MARPSRRRARTCSPAHDLRDQHGDHTAAIDPAHGGEAADSKIRPNPFARRPPNLRGPRLSVSRILSRPRAGAPRGRCPRSAAGRSPRATAHTGSGTSCAVTRSTGASSHSKQRLVDSRRDLAGDAARARILVDDQHAIRLPHRRVDRVVVERRERPQVDAPRPTDRPPSRAARRPRAPSTPSPRR